MARIYLAAPLFSEAEKRYNVYVRDLLVREGYDVYLPQEQRERVAEAISDEDQEIFTRHLITLNRSDVIVAVCDGTDTDSGTAWEMGYAHAQNIPVIALRTDVRTIGPGKRINLMLERSTRIASTLEELVDYLSQIVIAKRTSD
ncbi:MAG: nucleoside 2-deoxyribosyltransferase [Methanomicrobiales archaeon]|nr:nucleoside 2-deoxyribosyltransferase [Methanomicrobiales archaeon]